MCWVGFVFSVFSRKQMGFGSLLDIMGLFKKKKEKKMSAATACDCHVYLFLTADVKKVKGHRGLLEPCNKTLSPKKYI